MKRLVLAIVLAWPGAAAAETTARIVVQHAPLAGFVYYEAGAQWESIRAGDRLALVRDAANPYDANAVRVEWQGHMLGHVPRKENTDIARQLDAGAAIEARVTALERLANGRRRISYLIYVPLK